MEQKNPKKNEVEIDIIPILKVLLSKLWLMILVGIFFAAAVYGVTKLTIRPVYRCSFSAYVNNQHAQADKSSLSNQDLIAAQQLTKTLSYILKSNTILSASLQSINSDMTYEEFSGLVSTDIKDGTELISIHVINHDPQKAYDLANAIAKTAPTYMSDIVEGSSMKIVDYPVYSAKRYQPSYLRFAILGFLFGVILVAVIVLIRFFKDDTVRSESDFEQRFGLPILGVLPDNASSSKNKTGYYSYEYGYGEKPNETEQGKERNAHEK